ncbi:hypothetical protein ACSSZE_15230 [Acidithiobacillus caldus]
MFIEIYRQGLPLLRLVATTPVLSKLKLCRRPGFSPGRAVPPDT